MLAGAKIVLGNLVEEKYPGAKIVQTFHSGRFIHANLDGKDLYLSAGMAGGKMYVGKISEEDFKKETD